MVRQGLVYFSICVAVLGACSAPAEEMQGATEVLQTAEQNQDITYAPKIITPDERRTVAYPGHGVSVLADMTDTAAGVYIQEEIIPARSLGAPPHIHEDEDEYFIVLEGSISFLNGEDVVVAGPGTVAILPRGHWHGFWNPNDTPTRMLLAVAPGHFGSFFDDVVARIRTENAESPELIGAIIAQVAASRNVTVDIDRLPADARPLLAPPGD